MDRNQVVGWLLIALIIGGFVYYQSTVTPEPQVQKESNKELVDSKDNSSNQKTSNTKQEIEESAPTQSGIPDSLRSAFEIEQLKQNNGIFYTAAKGEDGFVTVENDHIKLWIRKKGGYLAKAWLKEFNTYENYVSEGEGKLMLFKEDSSSYQLNFNHDGKILSTKDFYFSSTQDSIYLKDKEESVILTLNASNGGKIEFVYSLSPNDYILDFNINVVDLNRHISGENNKLTMSWEQYAPVQEKSLKQERLIASIFYYNETDGRDYLSESSTSDETTYEGNLKWISLKQQFFSTVIISEKNEISNAQMAVSYNEEDTSYVKKFNTTFGLELLNSSVANSHLKLYLGPNDFNKLSSYEGWELHKQLNLGWGIFRWVNEYFIYPVFGILLNAGVSVGIAIILLTFVIKLILFPITYKNYLSSAKMRVIKPHLEKINEENKNADPLKKQQAVMALYKQTGVNPLAGCIPAILQMPILIALYRLFPAAIELRHESFLWAEDLSSYDSILTLPFNIWFYGDHVSLFTLLMSVSMFFYMRFNQQMTPTSGASGGSDMQEAIQKNMKVMMNIMPFIMLFIFNDFASGLSFYYFLANVITISQTLVIKNYIINENKILDKINTHMSKPMQKSKWQKKLEEIQSKQKK